MGNIFGSDNNVINYEIFEMKKPTTRIQQWQADAYSSLFTLDVAIKSQINHKLFSATYILCSKTFCNKKIEGFLHIEK